MTFLELLKHSKFSMGLCIRCFGIIQINNLETLPCCSCFHNNFLITDYLCAFFVTYFSLFIMFQLSHTADIRECASLNNCAVLYLLLPIGLIFIFNNSLYVSYSFS